jgi:hypothetical protein
VERRDTEGNKGGGAEAKGDERAIEDPTVKMKRRLEVEKNGAPKTGSDKH